MSVIHSQIMALGDQKHHCNCILPLLTSDRELSWEFMEAWSSYFLRHANKKLCHRNEWRKLLLEKSKLFYLRNNIEKGFHLLDSPAVFA